MRSKSAPGNSTPTSRRTNNLPSPLLIAVGVVIIGLAGFYVIEAFIAPYPLIRVVLRSLLVLPFAIWTLWVEKSRPLKRRPPLIGAGWRIPLPELAADFACAAPGF